MTSRCLILKLRLSERCTEEHVLHLWRTPCASDLDNRISYATLEAIQRRLDSGKQERLSDQVKFQELWTTPTARDYKGSNSMEHLMQPGKHHQKQLANAVKLWPTPVASDCNGTHGGNMHGNLRTAMHDCGETGGQLNPPLGRVANGVSNRVDRIRCLGNAVVPAQFYPIFAAIAEVERIQI